MKAKRSGKNIGNLVISAALVAIFLFLAWIVYVKPKMAEVLFEPVFINDVKKARIVSEMRVNLNASVEAEKSAVLAVTDEASTDYANQAMKLSAAVEDARQELGILIEAEKMGREVDLFREFSECWEMFRQIDQELLPLTVLNTNLKAYELSFDSAQNAIKQLEESLDALIGSDTSRDKSCEILKLSQRTLIAALKIHGRQASHIAENRPEKMDEIEATIQMQDERVIQSMDALTYLKASKSKSMIDAVKAAYAEFWRIHMEVINLSRQNTNVRSLAMSLGQKRKVTVQCQDVLESLEKAIQSKVYKATK
jgi:D-Tyr-tRNAtyr deacylase